MTNKYRINQDVKVVKNKRSALSTAIPGANRLNRREKMHECEIRSMLNESYEEKLSNVYKD